MRDGQTPKVADFGIAVLDGSAGDPTRPGLGPGTPGYVAPEQQYGLKVDERCDQYSLAAVAYELLTGPQGRSARSRPPSRHNPRPRARRSTRRSCGPSRRTATSGSRRSRSSPRRSTGRWRPSGPGPAPGGRRGRPSRRCVLVGVVGVGASWAAPAAGRARRRVSRTRDRRAPPREAAVAGPGRPPRRGPGAGRGPPPKTFKNSVGMKMLLILPGEFSMGSPDEDPDATLDERPRHRVKITPAVLPGGVRGHEPPVPAPSSRRPGTRPRPSETAWAATSTTPQTKDLVRDPNVTFRNPGYKQPPDDDEPVVQVTWDDATAFCDWLGEGGATCRTACRPRPSGSTPAGPARRPAGARATTRTTLDEAAWTKTERRATACTRSGRRRRTPGASTTCTATPGSGATTGSAPTPRRP